MITLIKYAVCFVIIFAVLLYIYGWVAESEREIAEEEAEDKYRREIENWKQTAQHQITHIKVLDGEEFIYIKEVKENVTTGRPA